MVADLKSAVMGILPQRVRERVSYYKRLTASARDFRDTAKESLLHFQCNICGKSTSYPKHAITREIWSCVSCGSNARWRGIVHALSMELFGRSMVIADFPSRPDLAGIGLSDWEGYANRLTSKLNYTNTHFHKQPFLDITNIDPSQFGKYDFLISSEVFEHIQPPTLRAFENARRLLKPGGVMIFTVPYVPGETHEHFPGLSDYAVAQRGDDWILRGTNSSGEVVEFTDLTFHGGPGTILEFRLFGKDSLLEECGRAGFGPIRIHDKAVEKFGICWNPYVAEQAPYRPFIFGLDTPPWALVNGKTDAAE